MTTLLHDSAEAGAVEARAPAVPPRERRRVLGLLDVTLLTVSAMLVVDQLAASAAIGTKSIGWWLLLLVVFLIPSGMIVAELGTTYPDQGGIYVWAKRAFGPRWATRTTWWYYINVALWMPAVFLLFAGVFAQLFVQDWTDWAEGKWFQVGVAIVLTWTVVVVGMLRLEVGKWVNNVGAAAKVLIIGALGVGGIVFAIRHGSANVITGTSFVPSFGDTNDLLPVIVYMLLGFELASTMGGEIKRPERVIPRSILVAGIVLAAFYVLGTVGILLALPLKDIGLVEGLVDTLKAIFGTSGAGDVAVYALGVGALYTFFTNMTTWSMGANRAAAEAASAGELPALLGREHPTRHTPVAAFVVSGIVATAVLLVTALFIETQDSLFYAVFAASSVVFLLPYLLMFPAVWVLRRRDPDRPRPYRVPGGERMLAALAAITTAVVAACVLLFLWPEVPGSPADWSYTGPLLGIVVAALAVGELLVARCLRRRS